MIPINIAGIVTTKGDKESNVRAKFNTTENFLIIKDTIMIAGIDSNVYIFNIFLKLFLFRASNRPHELLKDTTISVKKADEINRIPNI